jgi:uncharacterized membrane protein
MAKISSYPSDANVTTSDRLIGSDNENANETKNFEVGDIITLAESIIGPNYVPYTGATANVNLGAFALTASTVTCAAVVPNGSSIYLGNIIGDASGIYVPNVFTTSIGDALFNANGTSITIDDNTERITFVGLFNLSNGVGAAGEVLTSAGAGAPPSWTSLSATYVPYTGATANVDLGTNTITASQGFFPIIYASSIHPTVGVTSIYIGDDNPFAPGGGLLIDTVTRSYGLGDVFVSNNNTKIVIDDISQIISFVGGFDLSNGLGTAGQVLTSAGTGVTPQWSTVPALATSTFWKGSFYDSITQTVAAANTATPVILNNTDFSATNGISIVTDGTNLSRITFANAGTYNILFSAQLENSAPAVQTVDFWLRKNGSTAAANIADTNGKVQLQALTNHLMAAWNYFVTVAAGDYIQLVWSATSTNISIVAEAANALHPATPSIILTANIV